MSKATKNQKAVMAKYDHTQVYPLAQACALLKDITFTKFDATVELSVNLGVDPRKANQMIRGVVTLPNGTGKVVRVLALCTPDKEEEAKAAGADYVGLDEYIEKIKGGWTDIDVIVCTPSVMAKIGALGKILGPRGLMPNPKTGTVTMEIGNAVKEVKGGWTDIDVIVCTPSVMAKVGALGKILGPRGLMPNPKTGTVTMEIGNAVRDVKGGKIDFKVDKTGIVHAGIGKISFTPEQIYANAAEILNAIAKLKPQTLKGTYMKACALATTMSPGIKVDLKAFLNGAE